MIAPGGPCRRWLGRRRRQLGRQPAHPRVRRGSPGRQASQGVFITTSSFTKQAVEFAQRVAVSVVLIDGARLAELMLRYGVGVQVEETYTVLKLDEDYFTG